MKNFISDMLDNFSEYEYYCKNGKKPKKHSDMTFVFLVLDRFFLCFRVYTFLSMGKGASDVACFLDLMQRNGHGKSSSILNQTSRSLRSTLLEHGMTEALVDELATVAVRVNYGQG